MFLAEHIIHDVSRYISYRDLCIVICIVSQNTSVIRANGMFWSNNPLWFCTVGQELYCKTCVIQPLSKRPKNGFQDGLSLNAGQKYCRMLPLQNFRPYLSYLLSLRPLFCLFLSGCFTPVLLYFCLFVRWQLFENPELTSNIFIYRAQVPTRTTDLQIRRKNWCDLWNLENLWIPRWLPSFHSEFIDQNYMGLDLRGFRQSETQTCLLICRD